MQNKNTAGHLVALVSILIWGTTFISTKVLLRSFFPVEILFFRFLLAFCVLCAINPRPLKLTAPKQEWLFVGAGFSGVTLYYLLETISLTLTTASNVGVIIAAAPFFTAIVSRLFIKSEKPKLQFYIGFAMAMLGMCLIAFGNIGIPEINPAGDFLAAMAALSWAFYSMFVKKIAGLGYNIIQTTRRTFRYGLLMLIPAMFFFDWRIEPHRFTLPVNLFNLLYLSLGASALCFVSWNYAIKWLGTIKTSAYVYLVPVVTIITSALVLDEPLTKVLIIGAIMTLGGLVLSEADFSLLRRRGGEKSYPNAT